MYVRTIYAKDTPKYSGVKLFHSVFSAFYATSFRMVREKSINVKALVPQVDNYIRFDLDKQSVVLFKDPLYLCMLSPVSVPF